MNGSYWRMGGTRSLADHPRHRLAQGFPEEGFDAVAQP